MATGHVNVLGGSVDVAEPLKAKGIAYKFLDSGLKYIEIKSQKTAYGPPKAFFFDKDKLSFYAIGETSVTSLNQDGTSRYSKTSYTYINSATIDENGNIYIFSFRPNYNASGKILKLNSGGGTVFEKTYAELPNASRGFISYKNKSLYLAQKDTLYKISCTTGEIEKTLNIQDANLGNIEPSNNALYVQNRTKIFKVSFDLQLLAEYEIENNAMTLYIDLKNEDKIYTSTNITGGSKLYELNSNLQLLNTQTFSESGITSIDKDFFGYFYIDLGSKGICKIRPNIFENPNIIISRGTKRSFYLISEMRNRMYSYETNGYIEIHEQQGTLSEISITEE